jgi:hypothetical protein
MQLSKLVQHHHDRQLAIHTFPEALHPARVQVRSVPVKDRAAYAENSRGALVDI